MRIIYNTVCGTLIEEIFPEDEVRKDSTVKNYSYKGGSTLVLENSEVFHSSDELKKKMAELAIFFNQQIKEAFAQGLLQGLGEESPPSSLINNVVSGSTIPSDHLFCSLGEVGVDKDGVQTVLFNFNFNLEP